MKNKYVKCTICDTICYSKQDLAVHLDSFHNEPMTYYRRARKASKVQLHGTMIIPKDTCFYCGSKERITVDHVIPLSRGGSNFMHNKLPACYKCNHAKGALGFAAWREKFEK